jgi:hypothetical protein
MKGYKNRHLAYIETVPVLTDFNRNGVETMITSLLPKTLRNFMFVLGMVMITVHAPGMKKAQCQLVAPEARPELPILS